ncbi:MAG TPA: NAD(P)/FAD-dependent oxidoreductase [Acidimicrobiia bacterium]
MTSINVGVAARRPRHTSYDVVVVGARAAGASTSMLLARCGYRVLMVDRSSRGSDTTSTHTLLRTGVLQLGRWGLLDALVAGGTPPVARVTLGFGADLVPIDLRSEFGVEALYAPRRTVLDPLLQSAAVGAGVEYMDRTRLLDLTADETGRTTGVIVDSGSGPVPIRSRYVVGADGVWSKVARIVGAKSEHNFAANNGIRYAYYTGIETDGVHFQFTPGVTSGLIPTNENLVCVYLGLPANVMKDIKGDRDFRFHLDRSHPHIAASMDNASRRSPFRGTPGLPGFLRQSWGPGWALVGDSGYCKDPVSAHGLSAALRDSELCARAVDRALTDPDEAGDALRGYQETRVRLSVSMLRLTSELADYQWDPVRASDLMRGISSCVKQECQAIVDLEPWAGVSMRSFVGIAR